MKINHFSWDTDYSSNMGQLMKTNHSIWKTFSWQAIICLGVILSQEIKITVAPHKNILYDEIDRLSSYFTLEH